VTVFRGTGRYSKTTVGSDGSFGIPSGTPKNGHGIEKGLVNGNIYSYMKLCYIASKVHEAKVLDIFFVEIR